MTPVRDGGYAPPQYAPAPTIANVHDRMRELAEVCVRAQNNWAKVASGSAMKRQLAGAIAGAEILRELYAYHHGVAIRRHPPDPDRARALSDAVIERLAQGDLVLVPRDERQPLAGLLVVDPAPAELERELHATKLAAEKELTDFRTEHAELLAAAASKQVADRVRRALKGNDVTEMAAAIKSLPAVPDQNTMTTADL